MFSGIEVQFEVRSTKGSWSHPCLSGEFDGTGVKMECSKMRATHHCERLVSNEKLTSESLGLLARKASGRGEAIIDEGHEWVLRNRRRCLRCVALSYGSDWTRENDESDDK